MNIIDIITKKKNKEVLSKEEIEYVVNSYVDGSIKDYQMSSLLMAITINDMNDDEIHYLTNAMLNSGKHLDLSSLGIVVDKHSTGGVGDKTTLIVAPIVASCGVKVAKMSGRGLGHTGGTIDKLESIPDIKLNLTEEEFINEIKNINMAITCQTDNMVIADKKIYALRDVTGTVESIPLIASSIMSKKIASGASKLVLDVKVGSGALIKNIEDARRLSNIMVNLGKQNNIETVCLITNMDIPLGSNIGNALEIEEVIDILTNKKDNELKFLAIELSSYMVSLGLSISIEDAKNMVISKLNDLSAYNKFLEFIKYQNGNIEALPQGIRAYNIKSNMEGYITKIDAYKLGRLSMLLGAGRENKEDRIDYTAGIILNKKINDYVNKGEVLFTIYTNKDISNIDFNVIEISNNKIEEPKLIYEIIK